MDLCSDIPSADLKREAYKMLGKPSKLDCLMLTPPTRLVRRKPTTLIVFCLLFGFSIMTQLLITFPHLDPVWIGVNLIFTISALLCLCSSVVKEPGYLQGEKGRFISLLEIVDST